jgi:hypothetical protein
MMTPSTEERTESKIHEVRGKIKEQQPKTPLTAERSPLKYPSFRSRWRALLKGRHGLGLFSEVSGQLVRERLY